MLGSKILLSGNPSFEALPNSDGSFAIDNVPEGQYMLQVAHPLLRFDPVYIEAVKKGKDSGEFSGFSGHVVQSRLID